jgi:hypothetical protein
VWANAAVLRLVLFFLHPGGTCPEEGWVVSERGEVWVRVIALLAPLLVLLLYPVYLGTNKQVQYMTHCIKRYGLSQLQRRFRAIE